MEFDDLLKGLLEFIRALDELAQREVVKKGKGELMGADVAYSYTVRYLSPYARPRAPPTKDAEKPLVDVFDRGDHIVVVALMPNVKEEDLKFRIDGDTLKITSNMAGTKVLKEISIPKDSEVDKILNASFKNGVLEIRLRKKLRTSKDKG
jgi:HSP20 family molecular chaperone IbpA